MFPALSNVARRTVNESLRRRGYLLRWLPPRALSGENKPIDVTFPLLAAHLMLATPKPYFINIGANDGVTIDPIYPFVRDFGWQGIVVEPLPEVFALLQRNYASFAGIPFVHAAVGREDGRRSIYTVDMSRSDSLGMSIHSSFSREILLKGAGWYPDIETHIVEREVSIISFPTLLAKAGAPAVDVLKIDAEGYDLEILRSIDLSRVSPRLVMAEHANLSRSDNVKMADILLDHGYRLWMTPLDMLAYKGVP